MSKLKINNNTSKSGKIYIYNTSKNEKDICCNTLKNDFSTPSLDNNLKKEDMNNKLFVHHKMQSQEQIRNYKSFKFNNFKFPEENQNIRVLKNEKMKLLSRANSVELNRKCIRLIQARHKGKSPSVIFTRIGTQNNENKVKLNDIVSLCGSRIKKSKREKVEMIKKFYCFAHSKNIHINSKSNKRGNILIQSDSPENLKNSDHKKKERDENLKESVSYMNQDLFGLIGKSK